MLKKYKHKEKIKSILKLKNPQKIAATIDKLKKIGIRNTNTLLLLRNSPTLLWEHRGSTETNRTLLFALVAIHAYHEKHDTTRKKLFQKI